MTGESITDLPEQRIRALRYVLWGNMQPREDIAVKKQRSAALAFLHRTGGLPDQGDSEMAACADLLRLLDAYGRGEQVFVLPEPPWKSKKTLGVVPVAVSQTPRVIVRPVPAPRLPKPPQAPKPRAYPSGPEADAEAAFCQRLQQQGIPYERQVPVQTGIIDILTPTTIYELKLNLSRAAILTAIGQLLLYAQEKPRPNLVIYGNKDRAMHLVPFLARLGIRLEIADP